MKIDDGRMRAMHGYEEGKIDAVDTASSSLALSYKKDFLKHFIPITRQQIGRRLTGNRYYVTRKYDGEYAIIFHDGGQTVTINRSGRVRRGIPCIEEAGRLLDAAGIRQAVVPAEIYVEAGQGRGRLNALLSALADRRRIGSLRLAVFDLLETDGKPVRGSYGEIWKRLEGIFSGGKLVHPVEMEVAASAEGVEAIYDDWVEREGGEGLVVRSDGPFVYKIKPRHSLDAVVVGFSDGTGSMKGQVRSLLLALMPAEGRYQVVGRVGSGLTEEMRETLYSRFSREVIPSEYIVTDMDYVAFRMIRPETVIELTAGDLLYETESGPKQNTVLRIEANAYRIAATVDGVKLLAPVFVRVRMDKRADASDVRLAQIERFTASFDPTTAPGAARARIPAGQYPAFPRGLSQDTRWKDDGAEIHGLENQQRADGRISRLRPLSRQLLIGARRPAPPGGESIVECRPDRTAAQGVARAECAGRLVESRDLPCRAKRGGLQRHPGTRPHRRQVRSGQKLLARRESRKRRPDSRPRRRQKNHRSGATPHGLRRAFGHKRPFPAKIAGTDHLSVQTGNSAAGVLHHI